jgi:hypothetical protein
MTGGSFDLTTINKYIHGEISILLHAKDIYKLDSYGWTGSDNYDENLIGHAMWQTDSLSFRFLIGMDSTNPPTLKLWQKFLVIAGSDFEGLMEVARLSIGLTLFQHTATTGTLYHPDSFFPIHLMNSMLTLSVASDRIRDVFVAAVFQKTSDKYKLNNHCRGLYCTPFVEAIEMHQNCSGLLAPSLKELPALAIKLSKFRSLRNKIVHNLATEQGREQRDIINNPLPRLTHYTEWEALTEHDLRHFADEDEQKRQCRTVEEVNRLIEWYKLLIELSNHVFIAENTLRSCRSTETT